MLYYKIEGQGEAVVLIHGYLENHKMWTDVAERLSKNHLIIMPDLPGHGKSENTAKINTMDLMAEEIIRILDDLKIEKATFIGHSMGGYVTLAIAELFPERVKSFLLMNSSSLADTEEKKELRLRAMEVAEKNMEALIKMSIPLLFAEKNSVKFENEKEFARQMMRETSLSGIKAALRGMSLRPNRNLVLIEFDGKIGIILGENDRTVLNEPFEKEIPKRDNISILKLDCGHMSYLENKDETIDFVLDFINQ